MIFEISKESLPDGFRTDSDVVGTSEQNLADGDWAARKFVVVKANADNSDVLIIGPRGHAASGFRLAPGETSPRIAIDQANKIGIVAASGSQAYRWMAL